MSLELTHEQLEAIKQRGESPVFLRNPEDRSWYVLLPAGEYERIQSLLVEDSGLDIRETYPLQERVAEAEGWNDPIMDEYEEYDREGRRQ